MVVQTFYEKIVFLTHKFADGLIYMDISESHKPKIVNESLVWVQNSQYVSENDGIQSSVRVKISQCALR